MDGEHRGRGFIAWTIAWALVAGFLLAMGIADEATCDRSQDRFCGIGMMIMMALAAGAGLVWLVGMAVGALVVMLSPPSRPSCRSCDAPHDPGVSTCAACGRSLRGGDP